MSSERELTDRQKEGWAHVIDNLALQKQALERLERDKPLPKPGEQGLLDLMARFEFRRCHCGRPAVCGASPDDVNEQEEVAHQQFVELLRLLRRFRFRQQADGQYTWVTTDFQGSGLFKDFLSALADARRFDLANPAE